MAPDLREMGAEEFIRILKMHMTEYDGKFIFFLGAGCSVSSGIPPAGALVKNWLPRLKKIKTGDEANIEQWVKEKFPEYDENNPGMLYGKIIEELFSTPEVRQREIERIIGGKDPGFGYAVLAQLIGHAKYGKQCNVILTTNFDDLVADALYLYTNKKPLVISHESLISFVRVTRTNPVIIKLHGDARLAPKNTELETHELTEAVKKVMINLLSEAGIIFAGYGGNDHSILNILKELPSSALPWGIYWVRNTLPQNDMKAWLETRKAHWVKHLDFDELMLLMRTEFELEHPDMTRFDKLTTVYLETFKSLTTKLESKPDSPEKRIIERAIEKPDKEVKTWWSVVFEANKYLKTDSEKANALYLEGLQKFPENANLIGSYAIFITDIRKEYDRAEEYYQKALAADPDHPNNLGNYALFLQEIRRDYDRAEKYYKRALTADPNHANILGNYAAFLHEIREDYDRAEEYYQKALAVDPNQAGHLGNYAFLLINIRKEYDKAEEYYQKALAVDPNQAALLGNYASFIENIRKDYDKAEEYFQKALAADPDNAIHLGNYALFLDKIRKDYDKAEEYFQKALAADPDNAALLGNYANFLNNFRKNYDKAEEYYRKSLAADPNKANNLGNYAGFLLSRGNINEGDALLTKAIELADNETLLLECFFYKYAHDEDSRQKEESLAKIKNLIQSGARSPGWNLQGNVRRAIEDGHPQPEFLETIAKVISEEADAAELEKYEEWTKLN